MVGQASMPGVEYLDFDVTLSKAGGEHYAEVTQSPAGCSSERVPLPLLFRTGQDVEVLRLRVENALLRDASRFRGTSQSLSERALKEFGEMAFDAVFRQVPPIRDKYVTSRAMVEDMMKRRSPEGLRGLRLRLRIDSPEIALLPWEYLFDKDYRDWLALNQKSPIVRHLPGAAAVGQLDVDGPLNILGMIVDPRGEWDPIDAENERRRIDEAIGPHVKAGLIKFQWVPGNTEEQLLTMMSKERWHVFHFVGHGGIYDADEERADDGEAPASVDLPEGFIVLMDEQERPKPISASDLRVLLQGDGSGSLRLVVLNSCEGARGTMFDRFASPAASLVRFGIPVVLAMQFPITNPAAIRFSSGFYEQLAAGWPVEAAVTFARAKMKTVAPTEWGTPVLYGASTTGPLVRRTRPSADSSQPVVALGSAQPSLTTAQAQARAKLQELFHG